jgi:hypothetical protein
MGRTSTRIISYLCQLLCVVTSVLLQGIHTEYNYVCALQPCDLHLLSQEIDMSGL